MTLYSLLLRGPIDKPLQYQVDRIHDVNHGEWELAIASASLIYEKNIPRTLAAISCNYILGQNISVTNELIPDRQILGITTIGKNAGEKHTISFKRDFFIINCAHPVLSVWIESIEEVEGRTPLSGATIYLYLYLRRRR